MRDLEILVWCALAVAGVLGLDWLMMAYIHECTAFSDSAGASRCGERWRP